MIKKQGAYKHPVIGKFYLKRLFFVLNKISVEDRSVLDLGFGYGLMLPLLVSRGAKVYGLEPHKDRFEQTKKVLGDNNLLSKVEIFNESGECELFEESSFDVVLAISVMEHVFAPTNLYKEVDKILKQEGVFLVMVPTENRLYSLLRFITGLKKPKDHYYNSLQIKNRLVKDFLIEKEYTYYKILPLFNLFICRKKLK